jgi:hypothetical protein
MVALGAATLSAQSSVNERSDSWQWYVGPQVGVMFFETPTQSRGGIPVVGGHLLVIARNAGLTVSYEEAIGSDETSAIPDNSGGGIDVTFNNIRRYSGVLTIFPWSGSVQPYLGMGFGIQHVVNPNVEGVFETQQDAALAQQEAQDRAGAGFISGMVGFQLRPSSRLVFYGNYHLVSSAGDRLILGPTHTISAGIRIGLGRWKGGW